VIESGGPGGVLHLQIYNFDTSVTTHIRVGKPERAYLLPSLDSAKNDITFRATAAGREFVGAMMKRIHFDNDPFTGTPTVKWDVMTHTEVKSVGAFARVKVMTGMDPRQCAFQLGVELGSTTTRPISIPLEEGWALWKSANPTDSTPDLLERFYVDAAFRKQVLSAVAGCLCHGWAEGGDVLGLLIGERWEHIYPYQDDSFWTGTASTTPEIQQADVQSSNAVEDAAPKLIHSLWERRLIARIRAPIQILVKTDMGEEGEIFTQRRADGEVRIWEAFTGGQIKPVRVLHIMCILMESKAKAVAKFVGLQAITEVSVKVVG